MSEQAWRCGDCGAVYPMSVTGCLRPFDDYLSLRGGSIESAIARAVEKVTAPLVDRASARLRRGPEWSAGKVVWRRVALTGARERA